MGRVAAIGEDIIYLFHIADETVMTKLIEEWYAVYDEYFERCGKVFRMVYRKGLGIPQGATMEEETEFIVDTYGKPPIINPGFVSKLHAIQDEYEHLIGTPPDFGAFARKHDIELEVVTTVIDI